MSCEQTERYNEDMKEQMEEEVEDLIIAHIVYTKTCNYSPYSDEMRKNAYNMRIENLGKIANFKDNHFISDKLIQNVRKILETAEAENAISYYCTI